MVPATQNDFRHVTEHFWMSRSATPATRNEATRRLKHPKRTTSAEPYHRHGHTVLTRTVANGCGRLRPQTQRPANTPSTPRPPEWNGNPCYAFGEKQLEVISFQLGNVHWGLSDYHHPWTLNGIRYQTILVDHYHVHQIIMTILVVNHWMFLESFSLSWNDMFGHHDSLGFSEVPNSPSPQTLAVLFSMPWHHFQHVTTWDKHSWEELRILRRVCEIPVIYTVSTCNRYVYICNSNMYIYMCV